MNYAVKQYIADELSNEAVGWGPGVDKPQGLNSESRQAICAAWKLMALTGSHFLFVTATNIDVNLCRGITFTVDTVGV